MFLEHAKSEIEIWRKRLEDRYESEDDKVVQEMAFHDVLDICEAISKVIDGQGHSGMSYHYVMNIVKDLIDMNILTPIMEDDEYNEVYTDKDGVTGYQSRRLSAFFKNVDKDGKVTYHDNDRVICHASDSSAGFTNKFLTNMIDEMYPITLPYMRPRRPYVMVVDDYLLYSDPKHADFDTFYIRSIKEPTGKVVPVNKIFTFSDDGPVEITEEEFNRQYEARNSDVSKFAE